MKKFLPVLISICAVSCINACDDSQKVTKGNVDESLPNVNMEVHIDDVKQGEVNVQTMADFVQSVTASGETSNAIAISDFIQQVNNVPSNELDSYLAQYLCDYQSYADNMRPTDKGEKCAMVSCTEAKRSYYNVESENMFYADDAPMKNGCYRVKKLGKILMYKANPNSAIVWVYTIGDDGKEKSIDIDLDLMEAKTQVGGSDAVKVSDLFKAAGMDANTDFSQYYCDVRLDDGKNTIGTDKSECSKVLCSTIIDEYIKAPARSLDPADAAAAACFKVDSIKAVYVSKKVESYDPYNLKIIIDGTEFTTIDVSTLTDKIIMIDSKPSVKLSDIFAAANVTVDLAANWCDYEAADGWKPSKKDQCSEIRKCSDINDSYVTLNADHKLTNNVTSAENKNCYNVTDLATIYISSTDPNQQQGEVYNVKVLVDGTVAKTVDITKLDSDSDGKVAISDILAAAGVNTDLAAKSCEAISVSGNYKPSDRDNCKDLLSCDVLAAGYVSLDADHKVSVDGVAGCYGTTGMDQIEVTTGGEPTAYNVKVLVNGTEAKTVDITKLDSDNDGNVAIGDILTAAGVDTDLAAASCEAISVSGNYRPSDRNNCKDLLSCDVLAAGSVSLDADHKVSVSGVAGCYGTTGMDQIEVTTGSEDPGYIVSIYIDGDKVSDVDITKLQTNSGGFVDITTIFAAAGIDIDLATSACEGVAEDGYRPSTSGHDNCANWLSCEDFAKGDVSLDAKHKLVIPDAASCYGTKYLNRIDITTGID